MITPKITPTPISLLTVLIFPDNGKTLAICLADHDMFSTYFLIREFRRSTFANSDILYISVEYIAKLYLVLTI